jgi:hypothetical protein
VGRVSDAAKDITIEAARIVRAAGGNVVNVRVEPVGPPLDRFGPSVVVTVDADAREALEIWARAAGEARGKGFILSVAWTGKIDVSPEEAVGYLAQAQVRMGIPIFIDDTFDAVSALRGGRARPGAEDLLEHHIVTLQHLHGRAYAEHLAGAREWDARLALLEVASAAAWAWKEHKDGHFAVALFRSVAVLARALGHEDIAGPAGEAAELVREMASAARDPGDD